jgi:hypothetical protein
MPTPYKEILRKVINGVGVVGQAFQLNPLPPGGAVAVGALTANTRFTIAHGLGYAPTVWAVSARMIAVDDDGTAVAGLAVDKCDATNVTLKPSANVTAANTSFLLIIDLDTDIGGRPTAY